MVLPTIVVAIAASYPIPVLVSVAVRVGSGLLPSPPIVSVRSVVRPAASYPHVTCVSPVSRRACLVHLLILHERHLSRVLPKYVAHVNNDWPHQGIAQAILATVTTERPPPRGDGPISAVPILGGLHHVYRRDPEAAWHPT